MVQLGQEAVRSPRVLFWAMLHLDREKCKQHRFLVPMITMLLVTDPLSCAASSIYTRGAAL